MHDKKRFIGLVALGYLLGVLTAFLALGGVKLLRGGEIADAGTLGALVGLLLAAGGVGVALWLVSAHRQEGAADTAEAARREPAARPSAPAAGRPAFRRAVDDLPTVTDYYHNAADGVLPTSSSSNRDLDPASDPAFSPELSADGEGRVPAPSGA